MSAVQTPQIDQPTDSEELELSAALWDALDDDDERDSSRSSKKARLCAESAGDGADSAAAAAVAVSDPSAADDATVSAQPAQPNVAARAAANATHGAQDSCPNGASADLGLAALLPDEVLRHVLSFLSPDDLTGSAARVCRAFRQASDDPSLWRRLFSVRWGGYQAPSDELSWKGMYMERDRDQMAEIRRRIPMPMQTYYLQMTVGRRSEVLRAAERDATHNAADGSTGRAVAAWCAAHGLRPPPPGTHGCSGRPAFTVLSGSAAPVFVCERCGWAHVCNDSCRESIVDGASGDLVCPISGFCSRRLLTEEEEAAQNLGGREDREEGAEEPLTYGGRLGKAYLDGYMCADRAELHRLCWTYI